MDAENRSNQQKNFDQWLDSALRARMDAEPGMGLEDRVLARLKSEAQRRRVSWWPLFAFATAALAIAVALTLLRPSQPKGAIARSATQSGAPAVSSVAAQPKPRSKTAAIHKSGSYRSAGTKDIACCNSGRALTHPQREEHLPKLASFPTARPETEQERLLARVATQLAAQGQISELANISLDSPPKDLSITGLRVEPLEASPSDSNPRQ